MAAIATQLLVATHELYSFCILVALSGAAQAPIWPACIKALSSQVHENSIGTYVGLLGAAPYAGASFSSAFVTFLSDRFEWRHSMTPIFLICAAVSIFVMFIIPSEIQQAKKQVTASSTSADSKKSSNIIELFKINGVTAIASSVFVLKFAR